MPIRFRCVYCDKLLGIAKRKAGAVVNCPQCGQPLIVPTPEPEPVGVASAPAPMPAANSGKLFERDDFDVILQNDVTIRGPEPFAEASAPRRSKPQRAPAASPVPSPLPPRPFPVEQSLPPPFESPSHMTRPIRPRPKGMVLTTGKLIAAIVVVLVLMLAAFGGGVLVGRILLPNANG